MAPHLIGSCNPVVVQGPLTRVIPSSTDWRYTRQIAKITTRSEEVEQRTRCGEVVQRGKGVWVHPAPVGRGRIRPFLGDSDGWLQIADRGTNSGRKSYSQTKLTYTSAVPTRLANRAYDRHREIAVIKTKDDLLKQVGTA